MVYVNFVFGRIRCEARTVFFVHPACHVLSYIRVEHFFILYILPVSTMLFAFLYSYLSFSLQLTNTVPTYQLIPNSKTVLVRVNMLISSTKSSFRTNTWQKCVKLPLFTYHSFTHKTFNLSKSLIPKTIRTV